MASEVSQLSEMNSVLISSKEENERRRNEAAEKAAKISELEKQLEEQVAFTERYRLMKISATESLKKRAEKLRDLLVKLDHVTKQTSEVNVSCLALTTEGVQVHEAVGSQGMSNLSVLVERFTSAENRHREALSSKQEAKIARFPGENRSKENEMNELVHRLEVLGGQCKTHVEDEAVAEAANSKSAETIEVLHAELASLQKRMETAESNLEQSTSKIMSTRTSTAAAEHRWNGEMTLMISQRDSSNNDTQTLARRLAELCNDTTRQEQISALQKRQDMLTQVAQKYIMEMEEVKQESKRDDPKVTEMRAVLHGHNQRLHLLEDQLATASKAIASHSINEPDFRDRKDELERLTAKIDALRSTRVNIETQKNVLQEEVSLATERAESALKAANDKVSGLQEESSHVIAERKNEASVLVPIQLTATRLQDKLATLQEISRETQNTLEKAANLEKESRDQVGANDSEHERAFRHYQDITLEQQAEIESIERKIEDCKRDLENVVTNAKREEQNRLEEERNRLFMEFVTRRTTSMMAEIEVANAAELKIIHEEIVSEDARLRAACTEANQSAVNGAEARLEMELNDLLTQETAVKSEATWAEARVQRLKEGADFLKEGIRGSS